MGTLAIIVSYTTLKDFKRQIKKSIDPVIKDLVAISPILRIFVH